MTFFLEVGLLLIVLPWSPLWDRNYFLLEWPEVQHLLANNFVRGGVTGLGLVNLIAGLMDLAFVCTVRRRQDAP